MSVHLRTTALTFELPDGRRIIDTPELSLGPGRYGVVGSNGAGKSTLLGLLAGEITPTTGTVSSTGDVALLHQDLRGSGSVAQVLGIDAVVRSLRSIEAGSTDPVDFDTVGNDWDIEARAAAALSRAGLHTALDRTVDTLSGGEVEQLHLAAVLLRGPGVLLLDEPTNNLAELARSRVVSLVESWPGVLVLVSHDTGLLEHVDAIGELRGGALRWRPGGWSNHVAAVEAEQDAAEQAVTNARADVKRQRHELAINQQRQAQRDAAGRRAASGMPPVIAGLRKQRAEGSAGRLRRLHEDRLEASRAALDEAKDVLRDDREIRLDLPQTAVPSRRRVLTARALRPWHGSAQLDLDLLGPERVALTGPNGIGKTSLLRVIAGLDPSASGEVKVHVPLRMLPQSLDVLDPSKSVFANARTMAPDADPQDIRSGLARMLFRGASAEQLAAHLSGGERWRASLACLLLAEPAPQLLMLDEPTNNLDPAGRDHLIEALSGFRGALIVVTHGRGLIDQLQLPEVLLVRGAAR